MSGDSVPRIEPHPDGPRLAFAERLRTELGKQPPTKSIEDVQSVLHRSTWHLEVLADGRIVGRPRQSSGYLEEVTAESLRRASATEHDGVRMADAQWATVAERLRAFARSRAAAEQRPEVQRAADEQAEQRRRDARRAELERQRAAADRELAELDGVPPVDPPPVAVDPAPSSGSGWLRGRRATP